MRPIIFIKSWKESDHPRNRNGEFANADLPDKSAGIQTPGQAKAYWKKHFVDSGPHRIECQYGRRKYIFHVTFERNHSYTEDKFDRRKDEERVFSLERAQLMDEIWHVLRNPKAITWSPGSKSSKQFDGEISLKSRGYGRVVLKGTQKGDDLKNNRVSNFEFQSWHPISKSKFVNSKREFEYHHVNPLAIKKALSGDRAFNSLERQSAFLPETRFRSEALPILEGFTSAWLQSFQCRQTNRMAEATDRFTENNNNYTGGGDFVKSKSIPAGARWITVHPNGPDAKGQPLLVQEESDGSMRVIGGAGGKLNYLKLRNVKSEADYKKEAEERRQAQAEKRKEQRKQDKALGLHESKSKAREAILAQRKSAEREYVQTVAQSMGWDQSSLEFPEQEYSHLSDTAINKLRNKHHRNLLDKAKQAVDLQRQKLLSSEETRIAAGIGEVPLDAHDDDTLSVDDLDPVPNQTGGLGYSTDYKGRSERSGLTSDELSAETNQVRSEKLSQMTDEQRQVAIARGETAKRVRAELENIREPVVSNAVSVLADAKAAIELLKAEKKLKAINQQAKTKMAEVDAAKTRVEPKAFVLEYSADRDLEQKITEDIESDLRTVQTRAFLSEFQRLAGDNPTETVGKYMGVGAYNSINSLALAVGGDALVDRSVVDVLGIAGAAQVLARRIHTDLKEDVERIAEGVQDFHLHHYMEASEQALNQARELMDAAREIEIGEGATGSELKAAQALNAKRRATVTDAQKIVGQALGEMEANAALVVALKQGAKDSVQVPLGKLSVDQAIIRARAIGLQRGDYKIDESAGQTFVTINSGGMDRLAKPVNREDVEQIKRNLSIIRGDHDEDGWLPLGVANRPDLSMHVQSGVVPRLADPFQPGDDLAQSLQDYIGGRTADGDPPADILADIQSLDFFQKAGNDEAYHAALDAIAPLKDENGKIQRAEALSERFEQYADDFVQSRYGGARSPVNRQKFAVNQKSVDALHRALSETPEGVAAYKQIGELSNRDQRTLREFFYRNVAKESPEGGMLRHDLEQLEKYEPEKEFEDMFGDTSTNPEWSAWRSQRDELAAKVNAASLTWDKYIDTMRGHEKAYEALQDMIRSRVSRKFVEEHNKLNPDSPLKSGRSVIRNNLNHLDATDQEAREARMAEQRQLIDGLRERSQGRYAAGSVTDKLEAARERQEALEQSQMDFFSTEELPAEVVAKELRADERHTAGHEAERQIAGMMGIVGKNFKPNHPVKLWNPTMSGGKNAARQRLVKLVDANKRVMAAFGTGSGKSLLQLASFTHLHQQGKAKRGLFLVPSIVQGQFSGEALRYLEPGKFNWHIEPGAGREERIAAYKNPDHHFAVMTHAAFRDDMIHLGAKHAGVNESEMANKLNAMMQPERKEWMRNVMDKEGINFDYLTVDESQYTLNRRGKENSILANVVDSMSANTPYYLAASGDPVKNDASEVFDLLSKMDSNRYNDRAAFMRRYGADTLASKEALRREMARYVYPSKIDPDVSADRKESKVELSEGQRKALDELDGHFARARMARMEGKVDMDAVKAISPQSFEGVPDEQHEEIARKLQQSLGIMKSSAIHRVIHTHRDNPLVDDVIKHAAERKGKPGVVFARNLESVHMIAERLKKEGHRVVTITGADSSQDKDNKRLKFHPENGEPEADILVASDAGATGMNIQRGQWMYQFDVPQTAMIHAQRNGRIFRTGQKNNVELIDGVANHPDVHRARDRLQKKYGLRDLMTSSLEGLDDTGVAAYLHQRDSNQGGLLF